MSGFEAVIVGGTCNLLAAARKVGIVRALVYTLAFSVTRDNLIDLVDADETIPVLGPAISKGIYSLTKAAAEEDTMKANRAGRIGSSELAGGGLWQTCSNPECSSEQGELQRHQQSEGTGGLEGDTTSSALIRLADDSNLPRR